MAGTVKRKSLNRDKTNGAASSQRSDSVSKPPPFRFGKLSYNEARILSLERKSRTKLVNPNEGREFSMLGTKQARGLINTKLRDFQDDTKRIVSSSAKELLRRDLNEVGLMKESKSRVIQNGGFYKMGSNGSAKCLFDFDNGGQLREKSVATSITAKTHETSIRIANERLELEKRPSRGTLRDSNTRNFANRDQGCTEKASTDQFTRDLVALKRMDDCANERATKHLPTKGPTSNDAANFDTKSSNLETAVQSLAQDRLKTKQRRETRSSLVKQKSKRIPTRHSKYVSELDEKVRNKYRRQQVVKPSTENDKSNAENSAGKENKDSVSSKEPLNGLEFSNVACHKNTTHGPTRKQFLTCGSSKVQSEGKSEKSRLTVSKTSDRIEYYPSKQTMNGQGGRVKSAPVIRTCRNVESFLVRNGLIPKSSGKPEDSKSGTKVPRKKSIKLILSRSRAKSMRKKRIVNGIAKQKNDILLSQSDADVVSNGSAQPAQLRNGHVTNGCLPKGRLMNGHAANGHIASRHGSNGHVLNGRIPNGLVPNGHIQNGHIPNGHIANGNYKVCASHISCAD